MDLWREFDHVILTDMLEIQTQMRTPPEEREQDEHNRKFKIKLQTIVDSGLVMEFGSLEKTYEDMVDYCVTYKTVEKKVVPPEIQAKILAGVQLTQEELLTLT